MSPFSIVIIIVIIVLLVIIWKYVLSDPNTLQGIQSGQTASTISASSLATNGSSVPSSNFAYSVWFYINDWNYRYGETKVVFGRMGAKSTTGNGSIEGVSGLDPCPAVTLGAVENNVFVSVGCYLGVNQEPTTPGGRTIVKTCSVTNIPIQKWVSTTIVCQGKTINVYINGLLTKSVTLINIPKQNYYDTYIGDSDGFKGYISSLRYYGYAIGYDEVQSLFASGPSLKMLKTSDMPASTDYLSINWYFN